MCPVLWSFNTYFLLYLSFQLDWESWHITLFKVYGAMTTARAGSTFITSRNYLFHCVVRTFKIYCLIKFKVYNRVFLTMVTMLYFRFPRAYTSSKWTFAPLTDTSPFSLNFLESSCYSCLFYIAKSGVGLRKSSSTTDGQRDFSLTCNCYHMLLSTRSHSWPLLSLRKSSYHVGST